MAEIKFTNNNSLNVISDGHSAHQKIMNWSLSKLGGITGVFVYTDFRVNKPEFAC